MGYEQLSLSSPNRKVPGLFLRHAFKDAGLGTAFHPCSMQGFPGCSSENLWLLFLQGFVFPKVGPSQWLPLWESVGSLNYRKHNAYWMNWCPSMILVNRLLIVFNRTKTIRSSSTCLTLFSKIKIVAFCIIYKMKSYFKMFTTQPVMESKFLMTYWGQFSWLNLCSTIHICWNANTSILQSLIWFQTVCSGTFILYFSDKHMRDYQ